MGFHTSFRSQSKGVSDVGKRYSIDILRHSAEKDQMKTFVNLDGDKLGIEFDDDLNKFRFFMYHDKKKNVKGETAWCSVTASMPKMEKLLYSMVAEYYNRAGRLVNGELPMYTRLELKIPVTHLYYHANAGTLDKLLEKEVIYF